MRWAEERLHSPELSIAFVATAVALLAGGVIAHGGDSGTEWRLAYLALAAVLACALLVIFGHLGPVVLLAWPVLTVATYPWLRFPRGNPVVTFDRVWIGGMLAYLAIGQGLTLSRATRFLATALICFGVAYGVRAFFTPGVPLGVQAAWVDSIVLPIIVFFAARRYASTAARSRSIAAALMIAGGILGGIGLAERVIGLDLAKLSGGTGRIEVVGIGSVDRITGPYPTSEVYALSLVICLGATLYWLQTRQRGPFPIAVLAAGLEITGITLSLFRAAWIAGLLVMIGSFGIRPRRFARALGLTTLIGAILLAATSQLQHNRLFAARTTNTVNIYSRFAGYKQGIEIFASAPLTGVGVGRYETVANERSPVLVNDVRSLPFPHNSFIGVLSEQGAVGFLAFLAVTIGTWRLTRHFRSAAATTREMGVLSGTLAGVAAGYLIMSLTLQMLPYGPSNAFFALMVGVCAGRLDSQSDTPT